MVSSHGFSLEPLPLGHRGHVLPHAAGPRRGLGPGPVALRPTSSGWGGGGVEPAAARTTGGEGSSLGALEDVNVRLCECMATMYVNVMSI